MRAAAAPCRADGSDRTVFSTKSISIAFCRSTVHTTPKWKACLIARPERPRPSASSRSGLLLCVCPLKQTVVVRFVRVLIWQSCVVHHETSSRVVCSVRLVGRKWAAAALCVIFTILVSFSRDNALFASKAKIIVVWNFFEWSSPEGTSGVK